MRSHDVIAALCLLGLTGCSSTPRDIPDVILITWDTVRADHVGGDWTPTWNRLAQRGVVFSDARTPVPITLPAHASIMTGRDPPDHGARDNGSWRVSEDVPTLAEAFHQAGWETAAFVSATVLDSQTGIARGFSTYNDHIPSTAGRVVAHRPGEQTVQQAVDWLMTKPSTQPVFLWVHLFDPHRPWDESPNPDQTDYQAAIAKADAATARLLDSQEARGRLESSIISITSDHGEGLGEHGEETHGYFAYDSTIRVPMLLWVGRDVTTTPPTSAHTVQGPASLLDVGKTLAKASQLQPETGNVDLLSYIDSGRVPARNLSVETVIPAMDFDTAPIFGVLDQDGHAWFDLPRPERYNLDSDPRQLVNRFRDADKAQAAAVFQGYPRDWPPMAEQMTLSEVDQERLEALGYITGGGVPQTESAVDPKDRVDLFNLLTNTPKAPAVKLLEQADAMVEAHGMVPALMLFKADLLDTLARPMDALSTVRTAVQAHPDDRELNKEARARSEKLMQLNQLAEAIKRELAAHPENLTARRDLALTLHQLQRFDEAETIYRAILSEDPANDEVRVDLARMFASSQRYDAALGTLSPALRRPNHSPTVDCVAMRLMSRGKGMDAEAKRLLQRCNDSLPTEGPASSLSP